MKNKTPSPNPPVRPSANPPDRESQTLIDAWADGRMGGRGDWGTGLVLGLFPLFAIANPGGVQVSGRSAWDVLQRVLGNRAQAVQTGDGNRLAALWEVWRRRRVDTALCWHLDLLPLTRLTRGRRVLFLHGIEAWRRRTFYPTVQLLLANSDYTLARTLESVPGWANLPNQIVPLGVKAPCPLPVAPDDAPTAIMIGRMERGERYKGHEEVLAAWPRVLECLPTARLWIIGDGNLRAELEARVRNQPHMNRVQFFGRVDEAEKEQLLTRARCLVMPSRAEGFGLVYAEAMRLGRPCLVSTVDAGREIVDPPRCGLAANPGDPAGLSAAMVALLAAGPQWEERSRRARERYAEQYTEEAFQQRLLAALDLMP